VLQCVAFYVTPSAAGCVLYYSFLSCGVAACATVCVAVRVAVRVALTKIREQVLKLHERYLLVATQHTLQHTLQHTATHTATHTVLMTRRKQVLKLRER